MDENEGPDWLRPIASLERVIAVNAEVACRPEFPSAGRLIVASFELWADSLVVHFDFTSYDTEPLKMPPTATILRLRDDVGTQYRVIGGGGGASNDRVMRENMIFEPAVPSGASRLTIDCDVASAPIDVEL